MDEVNETLRDMEGHHGVFICTTDWLDSLGAAAALHCAALLYLQDRVCAFNRSAASADILC